MAMLSWPTSLTPSTGKPASLHASDTKLGSLSHKLVGNGTYYQQATDALPLSRWEMNTQIAERLLASPRSMMASIFGPIVGLPSGRQIHRLEVGLLHSRLKDVESDRLPLSITKAGQGGLAQMIAEMVQNFEFQRPRSTQIEGKPALALLGTWKEEPLERLWPDAVNYSTQEGIAWPDYLPHHVLVVVGQTCFHNVLEHRRYDDHHLASSASGLRRTADPSVAL